MSKTNIKEVVREKYGNAALRVGAGGSSCCGAKSSRLFHKGDGPEIVCDRAPSAEVRVETNQSRGSRGGPQEVS